MKVILEIWVKLSLNILERWVISWIYCFCHIIRFRKKTMITQNRSTAIIKEKIEWTDSSLSFVVSAFLCFFLSFSLNFIFLLLSLPLLFLHSPLPTSLLLFSCVCWQSSISTNKKILYNKKESRLRSRCQDQVTYLQEKVNAMHIHNANNSNRNFRL